MASREIAEIAVAVIHAVTAIGVAWIALKQRRVTRIVYRSNLTLQEALRHLERLQERR